MSFKLEHLQHSGSFKYRGATNAILSAPTSTRRFVTASGGNHGLAVAFAAATHRRNATIVVPENAPVEKVDRLRASKAEVVLHGREYAEAEAYALGLVSGAPASSPSTSSPPISPQPTGLQSTDAKAPGAEINNPQAIENARFIHAFGDPDVIAGQATLGHEILTQRPPSCDAVFVSVGGGGLISGIGAALAGSGVKVIGVEPTGAPTVRSALDAGIPVPVSVNSIAASSLGARITTRVNLDIIQATVDDVVLVDDNAIINAQQELWDEWRIAVEPGAALGIAAIATGAADALELAHPCVILCGANSGWKSS